MQPLRKTDLIVVTGAGGFIGGHLVAELFRRGFERVRAVDLKPQDLWYQRFDQAENLVLDLRGLDACTTAVNGAAEVFNLSSDMGGMGFIETHKADCMKSVLINTHLLMASVDAGVGRYLFASSACVYNQARQASPEVTALREEDAHPADPEDGYGWEKLFGEEMCRHFHDDYGIEVRVPRFHNVYGPHGTYDRGREKAPAAICRKVGLAALRGEHEIEIWGDGAQTRSFTYIDDCLEGIFRLMESDIREPLNLGSSELVSINEMVDIVETIANVKLERRYNLNAPQGVRGRNSDNTKILSLLGWQPTSSLRDGLTKTYGWIVDELVAAEASGNDRVQNDVSLAQAS